MSDDNQLIPAPQQDRFIDILKRKQKLIETILGRQFDFARYGRLILVAMDKTPRLAECSPISVINSVLTAASMGLEIRDRQAYLIPFKGKYGKYQCTLIIDYRGKIELAKRSGHVDDIEARLVYAGDKFRCSHGLVPVFEHEPLIYRDVNGRLERVTEGERGEMVLGYAAAWLKGSSRPHIEPMSYAQIEGIRLRSRSGSGNEGPWVTDFDQMARKTLIHRIFNYIPNSREMAMSQDIDDKVDLDMPLDPLLVAESEDDEKPLVVVGADEQAAILERKLKDVGVMQEEAAKIASERKEKLAPKPKHVAPIPPKIPTLKELPPFNQIVNGQKFYFNGDLYEYDSSIPSFIMLEEK